MNNAPIGIFDSGVGGLTVARSIIDQLPNEELIYIADTARGPYGPRAIAEVRAFALDIMDELVICGSVNHVVDQILALHEQLGGFGELVYAGLDWTDRVWARRSMVLMAEQVMPKVREAIGAEVTA